MPHLDEGILSALLDGELSGAEQQEVDAHLRACAECRDRLAELKGFMQVADHLVTALDEVPVKAAAGRPVRRRDYRALAWAASIVLAVGLGFAGRSVLLKRDLTSSADESGRLSQKASPVADTAMPNVAPSSPASEPESSPSASGGVAVGTVSPAEEPRTEDGRNESPARGKQVAQDAERRPILADSLAADSIGLRSQVAGTMAEVPLRGFNDGAAGAGAPAQADLARRDSAASESQGQTGAIEKDAPAPRMRASRENGAQSQSPPSAMLQPRDEVAGYAQPSLVGTRVIPEEEAVRLLGGSLRLVDSLTPVRVEAVGADSTVRVVYQTAGVEIWLDQRRDRGRAEVVRSLVEPTERKLVAPSNQLSWNDLQGFYLTLTGPLPSAALQQIKARIH